MSKRKLLHPMHLSENAVSIIRVLAKHADTHHIYDLTVYEPGLVQEALLTYLEARDLAGIEAAPIKLGTYLGEIARFCIANKLAPLNALVVNGKTRTPGGSYLGWGSDWSMDALACLVFEYPSDLIRWVTGTERAPAPEAEEASA